MADDALFSLDGFDEEVEEVDGGGKGGVAFPQSDDEESGTDGLFPLCCLEFVAVTVTMTLQLKDTLVAVYCQGVSE